MALARDANRVGVEPADGLDDFVCIAPDGTAYASINNADGDRAAGIPPTFTYSGKIKAAIPGYGQLTVRLGDVDGDGRADYCVLDPDLSMKCWRNGGTGESMDDWRGDILSCPPGSG